MPVLASAYPPPITVDITLVGRESKNVFIVLALITAAFGTYLLCRCDLSNWGVELRTCIVISVCMVALKMFKELLDCLLVLCPGFGSPRTWGGS